MAKQRIRKKTKRKTQKKTRSNSKSKTQRKTYRLRNKSKRKYRKRGGARTAQNEEKKTEGETKSTTPQQQVTSLVNRTANLPRFLQHTILHSSHPSVATGMYTNSPQRQGLKRRTASMRRLVHGVRNRLNNPPMRTRVALPGYPIGSLMTDDEITDLRLHDVYWPLDNAPAQNKEMKRLIIQQYLGFLSQNEIFGSGPFNSKTAVAHVGTHTQRKQQRQALLSMGNDINDRRINNELLPLPLQIVRTIRRHGAVLSDRYPRNPDGTIDETNDIFWPRNKREFYLYMINIPSFEDILIAVDVCLLDDDGF
jgi:hypothetical protein